MTDIAKQILLRTLVILVMIGSFLILIPMANVILMILAVFCFFTLLFGRVEWDGRTLSVDWSRRTTALPPTDETTIV